MKIIIFFLCVFISFGMMGNNDYFLEFKAKHQIKNFQLVLAYFIDGKSCPSCLYIHGYSINAAKDYLKYYNMENKVRIFAMVDIDRKIELKSALKKYDWMDEYEVFIGKDSRKLFGIDSDVKVCLFDSNGKVLFTSSIDNRTGYADKLIEAIDENLILKE